MVGSGTGYGSVQFYRFRIRPKGSDPDPQNCRKVSKVRAGTVPGTVKEIGLDTLEDRRKEADMVQVYKILSGKDNKDRTKLSWQMTEKDKGQEEQETGRSYSTAKESEDRNKKTLFQHQSDKRLERATERIWWRPKSDKDRRTKGITGDPNWQSIVTAGLRGLTTIINQVSQGTGTAMWNSYLKVIMHLEWKQE